jgi:hypothetical protein
VNWTPPWGQLVALVLGSGVLLVHGVKAKLRLGSTAVTLGHGNPALSVAEDATSALLFALALWVPVAVVVLLVALVWISIRRSRPAAARPA